MVSFIKKNIICILILIMMLAMPVICPADEISVDPEGRTSGYSARLYDNTSGLPTSEANDIAETSEGFIWIGSYSGLIRYDGNTFERLDSTTGIASVVSLFTDSRDRLWVGTNDSGVAVMEKGEFTMWGKKEGLSSSSVREIAEDADGTIYIATTAGIDTLDADMELKHLDDERICDAYMRDIRCGADGLMYALTQEGTVFTLKDGKVQDYLDSGEIGVQGVISFLPDPVNPGMLYLVTESSEVHYGSIEKGIFTTQTVTSIAALSYVERLEYINEEIWICAGDGIGIINGDGFTKLENLPMDNSISRMMADYEGNLWFTSTRQGVMKIVPNQFADIYERYGLEPDVVNAACHYGGDLFVGTDSGLTVIGNGKVRGSLPLAKAVTASGVPLGTDDLIKYLDGCRIRCIFPDSKGQLWICTWRKYGLLMYDGNELTAFTTEDGMISDRVRTVFESKDGSLLVANTGISIIRDGKIAETHADEDGIENSDILTISEGANGDIVLGSDGDGIYVIRDGKLTHLGIENGLASEVIMRIKYDAGRDIFWIVTSNSLAFMTSDYQITTINQFPYSNNFDLYDNGNNELWILSSNGIYVAQIDQLLANGKIDPVYYGMDNGLPSIATANSYSELTESGDLYMAGTTGIVLVNIVEPQESVTDLKVAVPYVDADDQRIYPDRNGAFNIDAGVRKLTVYSYVFNYSLINPLVTYHLEGFEDHATTVIRSDLMPVDYTNLPGGNYRFVIELNDSLRHSDKAVSVDINKAKAFYEQWWFYIIIGVLGAFLIVWFVRMYIRKRTQALEKKNRETMTLISEISEAFAKVIDMKDQYTNGHSTRVAKFTVMLARELGCDDETVEKYYRIALLHDIGKIGIPPEVLNKPGKLSDEEFETIKSHTTKGYEVLKEISIMPELSIGAQSHHERPDGRGYPNHLKQEEIPRVAQIIAVADCFDAMYSNRPYRNRMNFDKVVSIIREVSGTQLTPDVVDAFLRLVEKGEFRDPEDTGGGTMENIDNIKE